ncbi:carboxylate/amino acid/amine transporter [Leminorella richardii]|uniref:Threonine/homoserine exporter RhtA n=1 Tax=Leminorella richardii TaxID=158841 RepID=A0A2X4V4Y6_9GAMM|nr:DMT family transporter [Leminorella richardii]SQI41842.1 carboxylate/amino acid/amine transporter [Leminorella richardii]
MPFLIVTTIIWSFSFSLIGVYLAGQVDPWFSVLMRIGLASLLFVPFLKPKGLSLLPALAFMASGASQLGVMYLFYYHSFLYLSVEEVLLFGITMPIYITLIYDALRGQALRWRYLFSAALAVVGAGVINFSQPKPGFWLGMAIIQAANFFFALGQVGYKRAMERYTLPPTQAGALFYLGALCVAAVAWLWQGDASQLPTTTTQWLILLWLGFGASGLGYFMWNYGASRVDAGTLAIMNNAMIPVGLIVNFALWQEQPPWGKTLIGGGILLATLWVHQRWIARQGEPCR